MKSGITQHAERFKNLRPDSMALSTQVENPQRIGIIENSTERLAGIYFFNPVIIDELLSRPEK